MYNLKAGIHRTLMPAGFEWGQEPENSAFIPALISVWESIVYETSPEEILKEGKTSLHFRYVEVGRVLVSH